jgi:hypothetical protein
MSALTKNARSAALVFTVVSATCVASAARAETGISWLDSVLAAPSAAIHRPARVAAPKRVVQPVQVLAVAPEARSDCFWCNRRVFISGLSF